MKKHKMIKKILKNFDRYEVKVEKYAKKYDMCSDEVLGELKKKELKKILKQKKEHPALAIIKKLQNEDQAKLVTSEENYIAKEYFGSEECISCGFEIPTEAMFYPFCDEFAPVPSKN